MGMRPDFVTPDGRPVILQPARLLAEAKNAVGTLALQHAMVEDYHKRDRLVVLSGKIDALLREVIEEMARV